jgi:hypothetical protein
LISLRATLSNTLTYLIGIMIKKIISMIIVKNNGNYLMTVDIIWVIPVLNPFFVLNLWEGFKTGITYICVKFGARWINVLGWSIFRQFFPVEKFQKKFVYVFQTSWINDTFADNSSAKTGGIVICDTRLSSGGLARLWSKSNHITYLILSI